MLKRNRHTIEKWDNETHAYIEITTKTRYKTCFPWTYLCLLMTPCIFVVILPAVLSRGDQARVPLFDLRFDIRLLSTLLCKYT